MKQQLNSVFWDGETIKGSSINLVITVTILVLICFGAASDAVAARLEKLAMLIAGFFAFSQGIWAYKKIREGDKREDSKIAIQRIDAKIPEVKGDVTVEANKEGNIKVTSIK